jgi:hypothetical protein
MLVVAQVMTVLILHLVILLVRSAPQAVAQPFQPVVVVGRVQEIQPIRTAVFLAVGAVKMASVKMAWSALLITLVEVLLIRLFGFMQIRVLQP